MNSKNEKSKIKKEKEFDISETISNIADLVRSARGIVKKDYFLSVIIVAAGSSTRMNLDTTKQMLKINGLPVIVHTLLAFQKCDLVSEIIVVAKEDEIDNYYPIKETYGITKLSQVCAGGSSRQESALKGLAKIAEFSDFVAIHDGARCLISVENIEAVAKRAFKTDAAIAASKSKDTVKYADEKGFIDHTVDRNFVWNAQTPQIFKTNLYRAVSYSAYEKDLDVTDDASLAEHFGFKVALVDTGYENIKITTVDDIEFAKAVLDKRKKTAIEV